MKLETWADKMDLIDRQLVRAGVSRNRLLEAAGISSATWRAWRNGSEPKPWTKASIWKGLAEVTARGYGANAPPRRVNNYRKPRP